MNPAKFIVSYQMEEPTRMRRVGHKCIGANSNCRKYFFMVTEKSASTLSIKNLVQAVGKKSAPASIQKNKWLVSN